MNWIISEQICPIHNRGQKILIIYLTKGILPKVCYIVLKFGMIQIMFFHKYNDFNIYLVGLFLVDSVGGLNQ